MKKEIEEMVKRLETMTVLYELTEERKEKLIKLSDEIVDILYKRCAGPPEAAIVVHFLQEALEETMGAKMGPFVTLDDEVQS